MKTDRTPPSYYTPDDTVNVSWNVTYSQERYGEFELSLYNKSTGNRIGNSLIADTHIDTYPKQHSPRVEPGFPLRLPGYGDLNGTYQVHLTTHNITDKGRFFAEGHFIEFEVLPETGDLIVTKFHDLNGNGRQDAGEPGLENWEFTLIDPLGGETPKETGPDGKVEFDNLKPGNYTIRESQKTGWVASISVTRSLNIEGNKINDEPFGNYVPPVIDILKFEDRNADGVKGILEPGISGWEFTIEGPQRNRNKVYFTNGDGEIHLDGLVPGEYTIIEDVKGNWIATTPTEQSRTLESGDEWPVVFGNVECGDIVITKFEDINGNGKQDSNVPGIPDEPGIPDWKFTVEDPKGSETRYTTDVDGEIHLNCVIPGRYTAREDEKPEWRPTTPTVQVTELPPGGYVEMKFGNRPTTLEILKFEDINANGEQDPGERGLPNWEFTIKGPDGTEEKNATDVNGRIILKAISPGEYVVREDLPDGWVPTRPIEQSITLNRGDQGDLVFGNTQNVLIIVKFRDRNGNGMQDSGEEGLPDWKFTINGPQGTKTDTTDENGVIRYIYTAPGLYEVVETPGDPEEWYNTTPMVQQVSLESGPRTIHFGNDRYRKLTIFKFEDLNVNGKHDSGERGLSKWEFMITNNRTDERKKVYTDDTGFASYNLRVDREYTVGETIKVEWVNTTTLSRTIQARPEDDQLREDFGNIFHPPLFIAKFRDSNGTDIMEVGEEIIGGWNFSIKDPSGTTHPMTTVAGEYTEFDYSQFGFGNYTVEEVLKEGWINTTPSALVVPVVAGSYEPIWLLFGNQPICPCDDPDVICDPGTPPWNNNSDDALKVSKTTDPHVLDSSSIDSCNNGSTVKYEIKVQVEERMKPTDLVLAVDTSGSMVKNGLGPLRTLSRGIKTFVQKNGETPNLRIGLVSWDEDIDFILSPTDNYTKVIEEANNLSANPAEFTSYQQGINGALAAFERSPSSSEKVIVFITDARGNYRPALKYPEGSDYTVHMIVISQTTEIDEGRLENLTSIVRPTKGTLEIIDDPARIETAMKKLMALQLTKRTLKDVLVTDSLPGYMALHPDNVGNFTVEPTRIDRNGTDWRTTTMVWDVGDLSSDENWSVSFDALFCWRMPADARERESSVKSEVDYVDPETGDQVSVLIPEGGIRIVPGAKSATSATSNGIPGFSAWIGGMGLLAAVYLFRKR